MSDDVILQNIQTAKTKLEAIQRASCFDAFNLESKPTEKQDSVFRDAAEISSRYVVSGNQTGKSQMGAREVSWVFEHKHPYWDTKAQYGDAPLLILVVGRVGEQVETELWARKIKPFLTPGSYKEIRTGNSLQRVVHNTNKNTIVFLSHHNVNEARQKVQAFTAAYVWLDEMPQSLSLLIELELRVQANDGRLLATFTPLLRNIDIKDRIESCEAPLGRKYQFAMLDNPIYRGREDEILKRYENLPEDERNARLYGEWFKGGQQVYNFDSDKQVRDPEAYHPNWPHLEVVDPAASGKAGFLLLANKPGTRLWYVVKSHYIQGAAASDLLEEIEKITTGYNVIRKISDPHETWFIKEAAKQKRYYAGVYKKNDRKNELIKNLQTALNEEKIIVTSWVPDLIDELNSCMWKEDSDRIIGASRFHLLDCAQYAVDSLPTMRMPAVPKTFEQDLREKHKKRVEARAKAQVGQVSRRRRWRL